MEALSRETTNQLNAAIISFAILIMALIGFDMYARSLEQRYVNALAPLDLTQQSTESLCNARRYINPISCPFTEVQKSQ